jgi:ACS family tartrate transporter-like MFS transporter
MGFIKDATGSFALALLPLVGLSAIAAVAILWIGRNRTLLAIGADKAAVTPA